MKSKILGLLAGVGMLAAATANAGTIYDYQGSNFTGVSGSAPVVTTSSSVSGWIEFASAPTSGQTGKNDVIAFLLTDGATTYSSAAGDDIYPQFIFFDFDASLAIVAWWFFALPNNAQDNADLISTINDDSGARDLSRIGAGAISLGFVDDSPGVWTARPTAVPEPGTLALLGLGLAGLGFSRRRKAN